MNTAVGSTRYGGDDKMVPQALLDEKMQELLAKDETIQVVLRRNGSCRLIKVQRLGTKFC